MNVITYNASVVEIAPRYFITPVVAIIENEATNISQTASVSMTYSAIGNYGVLDISTFSFVDGNVYLLKVIDDDTEIFRGKVYYVTVISEPFERAQADYIQNAKNTKYTIYER